MVMSHPIRKEKKSWKPATGAPDGGFIWFTGFIGAFIFYVGQVDNFGAGVVAFLKALVWPAFVVYQLLS